MQKNFRKSFGRVVLGSVALLAVCLSSSAQAGWGSYGSGGGSWSGYGSTGSWGGWSSYGGSTGHWSNWCRPGLLHRVFHHHHHYGWGSHGSQGSWGSTGGSSGGSSGGTVYRSSYSSFGGSTGGVVYGSSGGSTGGHGSTGGTILHSAPAVPAPGPAAPANAPAALPEQNKAALKVNVPEDALVYVNGILTKSVGPTRTYVSRGLNEGFQYTYEVRAETIREGKKLEETKVVSLKAGDEVDLAFQNLQPAVSRETTLTLQVPADAQVLLGGNPTQATGTVRTFTTTKLAGDNAWANYTVQVSVTRGGRQLTQEKSISLKAGDSQSLSFDFEDDQVAAR